MSGCVLLMTSHTHLTTPSPFQQPYEYVGAAIDVVIGITLAAVVVTIGAWTYFLWGLENRVIVILEAAIRKEVSLQDDRIQKRLQRMEGQATESVATSQDNAASAVIGRPYRRP